MHFSIFNSYLIYLFTFIIAALFAKKYADASSKFKYISFFIAISIPALNASIRGIEVGTDYQWYLYHINEMIQKIFTISDFTKLDSKFEFGFNLFLFLITRITNFVPLIVFIVYAFLASIILLGLNKLLGGGKSIFYGYLFYLLAFWLYSYNGLRQAFAIAIVFYAISFIKERKIVLFFLAVLVAVFFHRTAIVVAPLYFLYSVKSTNREQLNLIIIIVGVIFSLFFIDYLSSLLGYENYLYGQYANLNINKQTLSVYNMGQQMILLAVLFVWREKIQKVNKFNRFYFNLLIVFLVIQSFTFLVTIADRLNFYFEIMVLPLLLELLINREKMNIYGKAIMIIYIVFYLFIYKFIYVSYGSGNVIPYSIFW